MSRSLFLRHNSAAGSEIALRIIVSDAGTVALHAGTSHADEAMALIGSGVFSMRDKRKVLPTEGEIFIRAVATMLYNSSVWQITAE